jgi:putative ABC transport system permease protein
MLGVIIGVAAVIIMVAISAGTEKDIADRISGLGTNLVFVSQNFRRGGPGPESQGSSGGLTYDDAAALSTLDGVVAVVVEQQSSQTVRFDSITLDETSVLGSTPDLPEVRDLTLQAGRYFTQEEVDRKQKVAVLGSTLAEELFGDGTAIGQSITVGNTKLAVIGVFDAKGQVGNVDYDSRVYIPITVVFQKFSPEMFARVMGDRVNMIYVKVDDQTPLEDVISKIEVLLVERHEVSLDEPDFTVTTQEDIISTQESTTASFRSLLSWVAAVSLVVGGIGIMNIMMVSVTERTREIGIRQAVGASPNDIRAQFLAEALLLSLVGGLIGVISGVGGSWLFDALGGMTTVVSGSSILLAFLSSAAVGIFFGYYPANQAAQLDPIEALRHE